MSILEQIMQKVLLNGECWEWQGANRPSKNGKTKPYGAKRYKGKTVAVHRLMWELHNGMDIPKGLQVLHKCDNPPCCNPAHLFLGTQIENIKDCGEKGRASGGKQRGDDHQTTKISDANVKLLRSLYKGSQHGKRYNRDGPTVTELAKQFGISRVQVCRIINLESR